MRKFDKKLNIVKANLLNEQRYINIKEGVDEGWGKNLAAGVASLAAGAGANAQAQQAPQQNQATSIQQQAQAPKADDGKTSNAFNAPRTLPIVYTYTTSYQLTHHSTLTQIERLFTTRIFLT